MATLIDEPARDTVRAKRSAADDDPVRRYLREIGRVSLLTAEQEVELGRRIENGEAALRRALAAVPAGVEAVLRIADDLRRGALAPAEVIALRDRTDITPADVRAVLRALARVRRWALIDARAARVARRRRSPKTAVRRHASGTRACRSAIEAAIAALPLRHALVARLAAELLASPPPELPPARLHALRLDVERSEREVRQAKRELMEANLRLVVAVAKRYANGPLPFLDLIQEGNLGLMRAVDRFQYRRGFKFSTYATWWIRQGITRALADHSRTIRLPVHMVEALQRMRRVHEALVSELGIEPTPEEVARRAGVSMRKLPLLRDAARPTVPLESPVGDDAVLGDFLEDRSAPAPSDGVLRRDLAHQVQRSLATLSPRERAILRLRFGLGNGDELTLEEVGERFALTRERIRQVEAKALRKLRRPLRNHNLVAFVEDR